MKEGQWALIAGSAKGMGEAFTTLLAAQGFNLILADHQEFALQSTADRIKARYHVETIRLVLDLGDENAWEHCMKAVRDVDCRLLVYNAARSEIKSFLDHSTESLNRFLDVNNRTAILLVHAFASHLRDQGKTGRILLMSSLAGLMAPVFVAPYAASKAFLITLARSLFYEIRPFKISISVCVSGIINTPKFLESRAEGHIHKADPYRVAEYAIKMSGKKAVYIHGMRNRLNYFLLSGVLPASLSSYFVNRAMRKMYPKLSL